MSSTKNVYFPVPHESHRQYCAYYPIWDMAHVALKVIATYQIQISDEYRCINSYPDKVTNITVK